MTTVKEGNLTLHKMQLITLTPVFIGGGEDSSLGRTKYILDTKAGKVGILDESKWARFLTEKRLFDKYLDFIRFYSSTLVTEKGKTPPKYMGGLQEWLNENGLKVSDYKSCLKYVIDAPKMDRAHDLHCFIKNSDFMPYFPGSSIKGAIRTAVLFGVIKENQGKFGKYWNDLKQTVRNDSKYLKKDLQKLSDRIESEAFRTIFYDAPKAPEGQQLNDIFKGMYVSDSLPIPTSGNMAVLKKLDISTVEKNRTYQKHITLYREYLKPSVSTGFTISLDHRLVKNTYISDIEKILGYLNRFTDYLIGDEPQGIYHVFDNLEEKFNDSYEFFYPQDGPNGDKYPPNLTVGGGVGFLSKTIIHALAPSAKDASFVIKEFLGSLKEFEKHEHKQKDDIISPRTIKLADIGGLPLVLGWCHIREI